MPATFMDCSKVNNVAYFNDNPCETFMLRSDRLTPAELADEVLAAAGLRNLD